MSVKRFSHRRHHRITFSSLDPCDQNNIPSVGWDLYVCVSEHFFSFHRLQQMSHRIPPTHSLWHHSDNHSELIISTHHMIKSLHSNWGFLIDIIQFNNTHNHLSFDALVLTQFGNVRCWFDTQNSVAVASLSTHHVNFQLPNVICKLSEVIMSTCSKLILAEKSIQWVWSREALRQHQKSEEKHHPFKRECKMRAKARAMEMGRYFYDKSSISIKKDFLQVFHDVSCVSHSFSFTLPVTSVALSYMNWKICFDQSQKGRGRMCMTIWWW